MKIFLILAIAFISCTEINSLRKFRHGLTEGGTLAVPYSDKKPEDFDEVSEEWFNQTLDHFNPTDGRTWQQRYLTNDQFFNKTDGPVFLMIGGEGEAPLYWMVNGSWIDLAKKYGALLIQVEHRFYGQSHPTDDLSTENLEYLTSQQALADLATFIVATNQRYNFTSDNKWIAFGGSYPGNLAAWVREKYPHLIHGAVASSAPILAQKEFLNYFKVVAESLATYSDSCVTAIQQGVEQIGVLLKRDIGQENLNQLFTLCSPVQDSVNNPKDLSFLYQSIAYNFGVVVQYNKDIEGGTAATIDDLCELMLNETIGSPIERLAAVNSLMLPSIGGECLNYKYDAIIEVCKNASWDSLAVQGGSRQWLYQTCTEFGFLRSSNQDPPVFGDQFPLEIVAQQCTDIFGENVDVAFVDRAVNRTNTIYGGLGIDVTNVVFTHGSIDPWHALGVLEDVNDRAPVIYIQGTAHGADMFTPNELDLPQLVAARERIDALVGSWLGVSNNPTN